MLWKTEVGVIEAVAEGELKGDSDEQAEFAGLLYSFVSGVKAARQETGTQTPPACNTGRPSTADSFINCTEIERNLRMARPWQPSSSSRVRISVSSHNQNPVYSDIR